MARGDQETVITQSVLDRLIDLEPDASADPYITRSQGIRQLKAALRRDLEWLLNARRTPEEAPEGLTQVRRSLYHYGLPDFTTISLTAPRDRARLLRALESAIALFEPRLAGVKVNDGDTGGASRRTLHFHIEGLLMMDPAPEQVSFDTVLQLTSGEYQVKGERSAG